MKTPVTAKAEPTAASERIAVLDVLRGLALYGVLLANTVVLFSAMIFVPREQMMSRLRSVDEVFLFLCNVFVDGKAMALLTFLFGLGFSLQLQRAEAKGGSVVGTHLRRSAALFFIGVCHVLLLWWGDILWGYAIAATGLLLFRNMRGRKLLILGVLFAFGPRIIAMLPPIAKLILLVTPMPPDVKAFQAQVLAAITGHDRILLTKMHVLQVYYFVGHFWVPYFPELLGRFLIGYWAGTTGLFQDTEKNLPLFRRIAKWGITIGLILSSLRPVVRMLHVHKIFVPSEWLIMIIETFALLGSMVLACGYAAGVVLLMQRASARRILMRFAPAGQMPLTTYLGMSVLSTFVFYGFGLGLAPFTRPATMVPITLGIFSLQIFFAHAWLSRFRFGPMDWLWRSLSYGRIQPMRRSL